VHGASLQNRGVRERFPILSRLTYLNSCSQGALSTDVREAYEQYLRDWDELGSPWELWVEKSDEARRGFARLVGASPDDVAVTVCVASKDPDALVRALRGDGIVTSSRGRNVRVSMHFYNTNDDVDIVLAALARHRELLA
jgi:selenocysteine lyase/cysteine desulfurase